MKRQVKRQYLRDTRMRLGVTLEELANEGCGGIARQSLQYHEFGMTNPTAKTASEVAAYLSKRRDEIVKNLLDQIAELSAIDFTTEALYQVNGGF
ncbi:helix-turn-helix transcriptional regulator [Tumebacillus sp. ITR2]|uniref:Helix-turn-helix transcriptional regulator n=1 Tax=Tumebacillus amylolyticus TaxID=2801339 RepID=A0ABS1JC93_9BACL|nr:helix-turn-helix transcriptional regulator [Tumebacillus amylolyticus]MBL0387891.1 helix-turn-helix transcriptional regulator [Tumebacillus amylolyticus]